MRLLKQPYTSSYILHPRSLYSSNNYITVISRIFRTTVNPLLIRHTFRALCPLAPRSSCCASCLGRCETAETVGLALWSRITFAVGWVRVMVTHTCKIYTTTYHARTQSKVYISRAQCIASPESKHIDERNAIWVPGWWCLRIHFGSNNNYQSKKYISRRVPCAVMVFARICRCLNAAAPDAWPMRARTPSPFNIICALPCICWELTVNTRINLVFSAYATHANAITQTREIRCECVCKGVACAIKQQCWSQKAMLRNIENAEHISYRASFAICAVLIQHVINVFFLRDGHSRELMLCIHCELIGDIQLTAT